MAFQNTDQQQVVNSFITKSEWIYNKLKHEIAHGELSPGHRLIVSKIAKQYKVSAMPVRDALNRLAQDGFIEITPHSGATVISHSIEQLYDIMIVRQNIEALAASLAVPLITAEDIAFLTDLHDEMCKCAEEKNVIGYEDLNWKFHEYIYSRCGNETLYDLVMGLWRKSSITRTVFMRIPSKTDISAVDHAEFLAALADRDSMKMYELMHKHVKFTTEHLFEML